MAYKYELRPNKAAFLWWGFLKLSLIIFIIFSLAYWRFRTSLIIIGFLIIELIALIFMNFKYKKESYIFYADKIFHRSGSIFSSRETELVIKNITHVVLKLPYLEHSIFSTGSIGIESAGTACTEITLNSVDKPREMYDYIKKLMKHNGFSLEEKHLIQEEEPALAGVLLETIDKFIRANLILPFLALSIALDHDFRLSEIAQKGTLILTILFIILLISLIYSIFSFFSLKMRQYRIYKGIITYTEGFLTKNYSFIPIENIADAVIQQTFIERLLDIYDVALSCQGVGNEIHFKNMAHGPELEKNIDSLIGKKEKLVEKARTVQKRITKYTGEFSMDMARTLVPLFIALPICIIILPLIFAWAISFLSFLISVFSTRYYVKPNSMEKQYNFISTKNTEFTNDKIMAVVFKENLADKLFHTCSIHFWSIGSTSALIFANIKKTPDLYGNILAKVGISHQEEIYKMDSEFSLINYFKSILFWFLTAMLFTLALLVLSIKITPLFSIGIGFIAAVLMLFVIYSDLFYHRSHMRFYKDYVLFKQGILFQEFYYVPYDSIKDIVTTHYPFSDFGSILFNIAGEHLMQEQRGKKRTATITNHFKIGFVRGISTKDELIDLIMHRKPGADELNKIENNVLKYTAQDILVAKPSASNIVIKAVIFCVTVLPLIILLPIIIPLLIWSVKVKSYSIQNYRVIAKSGIFYKKQISVIFSKIDHINYYQGFFNKLIGNGNIKVNTTGSMHAELKINDIPNYRQFYEELKRQY